MSLSAAQIFVATDDAAAVEEVVAQALAEWANGVGALPAGSPVLERHIVILPPVEGFLALIEEEGRVDRALARNLRARLGVLTIAAELDGHFFTAAFEANEPDGDVREWSAPVLPDDPEAMPIYEDVEAELHARLLARGVPSQLIATEWEDMIDQTSPQAEGARLTAIAGVQGLDKTVLPFGDILENELVPGPRVRPDLWVAESDGAASVVEARRLTGRWSVPAVEALVAIEEQQAARILSALAWTTEASTLPRIAFDYGGIDDVPGPDGLLFDAALRQARTLRPLLPAWLRGGWLSIRGLVDRVRARIEHAHPEFDVGRTCGHRLELRHHDAPNASLMIDLRDLWRRYFEAPDELDAALAELLPSLLSLARTDPAYDEDRLFPLLLGRGAAQIERLAVRPLADGIWIALGVDTAEGLLPLSREALRASGVGFDDALEIAIARLDLATEQNDEFVLYEQPEGVTLVAEFPDPSTAARLLSPAVLGHVAQQLGDGCYVAIPARDALLAAEATPEAREWLDAEVARRYVAGDLPLTTLVWSIENGELVEAGRAEPQRADRTAPEEPR